MCGTAILQSLYLGQQSVLMVLNMYYIGKTGPLNCYLFIFLFFNIEWGLTDK
jgi:hypothetical protein